MNTGKKRKIIKNDQFKRRQEKEKKKWVGHIETRIKYK